MELTLKEKQTETAFKKAYDPKFPVATAARYLGVSLSSTWRLIWSGKLKTYKVGTRTLVGLSHIENYLTEASPEEKSNVEDHL